MKDRIAVDPNVHFGKPCIAGTRIPVLSVLELVWEGLAFQTIIQDYYPDLHIEDLRACVRYAMDVLEVEDLNVAT
ncbi:MAG: antitoxin [SAR202 cluster bacterium Io17-Chloro-G9]|nr:MAG: antitoxin [SAR202 cluster bacterium Io17-Chloro-G9]